MAGKKRFHPATKAEPGNTKALKHGCHSEQKLAPLREAYVALLADAYPEMDELLRTSLASRLAKMDLAEQFMDANGVVKPDGDVYRVAIVSEKWSRRAEDLLRAAGVQRAAASPVEVALAIAALSGGEE